MTIVGVSFGKPEKAARWVENQSYPFEVWSDTDKVLARALGAGDGMTPKRITAVLDARGKVVLVYPEVSVGTHPGDVLADVQALAAELKAP